MFFTKLKKIGDRAGVPLPEPNALELMDLKEIDLLGMLRQIREEQGLEDPIINPFADLFSQPINPKVIARILRRETPPDYGFDALMTGELFNQLPQLLRQAQPVDVVIKNSAVKKLIQLLRYSLVDKRISQIWNEVK